MSDIDETMQAVRTGRRKQQLREHRAAQHAIRALVDFLAASAAAPSEQPVLVGVAADLALAKSGAIAAARKFIEDCAE